MRTKRTVFAAIAITALFAFGCADGEPVGTELTDLVAAAKAGGPADVIGETGPGALYALHLPEEWNGDLVIFARGAGNFSELPDFALRVPLLAAGFGVAYSSYSPTAPTTKDALIRTRQLRGLFTSNFGEPKDTYIIGRSLGARMALMAAEQTPNLFAGVMPICGAVGGTQLFADYQSHTRVLFDFYYGPEALPGSPIMPPEPGVSFTAAFNAAVRPPPKELDAFKIAAVDQTSIPYVGTKNLLFMLGATLFFGRSGALRGPAHLNSFDNMNTVYTSTSLTEDELEDLDAGVARFAAHPSALSFLERLYQPDGNLKIPVLTLHNTRDWLDVTP